MIIGIYYYAMRKVGGTFVGLVSQVKLVQIPDKLRRKTDFFRYRVQYFQKFLASLFSLHSIRPTNVHHISTTIYSSKPSNIEAQRTTIYIISWCFDLFKRTKSSGMY